jgi:hypothetical protein
MPSHGVGLWEPRVWMHGLERRVMSAAGGRQSGCRAGALARGVPTPGGADGSFHRLFTDCCRSGKPSLPLPTADPARPSCQGRLGTQSYRMRRAALEAAMGERAGTLHVAIDTYGTDLQLRMIAAGHGLGLVPRTALGATRSEGRGRGRDRLFPIARLVAGSPAAAWESAESSGKHGVERGRTDRRRRSIRFDLARWPRDQGAYRRRRARGGQ